MNKLYICKFSNGKYQNSSVKYSLYPDEKQSERPTFFKTKAALLSSLGISLSYLKTKTGSSWVGLERKRDKFFHPDFWAKHLPKNLKDLNADFIFAKLQELGIAQIFEIDEKEMLDIYLNAKYKV